MSTNVYPRGLSLSSDTMHGRYGKMVTYYDVGTMKTQTEKAAQDHEAFKRQADASLLHHMVGEYLDTARVLANTPNIYPKGEQAYELLRTCFRALSPAGDRGEQFAGFKPYSGQLITVAAGYIRLALQELDCSLIQRSQRDTQQLYNTLFDLCMMAEQRYETINYND